MSARLAVVLAGIVLLAVPPAARAELGDEQALAERFAPVVRLVEQTEECGHGEPYEPMDVNALFGQQTVALRGPWNPTDLVAIGPGAADLAGRYEYHLDFPGSALDPGCGYERWARLVTEDSEPTVYAHVATERGRPGKLALQYWFFYAFNEFNNLHEGDWETVQLVFDADTAGEALQETPSTVGYSSHEGAEQANWRDDKLERVGDHPVVYPAAGSHANKYTEALYLGSSADAGVGCDDTRGPYRVVRPVVRTIPSDPEAAAEAFPWLAFQGRWGELQKAFFNGPTGPNLKTSWIEPITESEDWRDRSYAVPTSGILGTGATDFFCSAVETGSRGLVGLLRSPGLTLLVLALLVAILIYAATRTTWRPGTPLRTARRRTWGQILTSAARMYGRHPALFLGIGVLFVPLGAVIALVQALVIGGLGLAGVDTTGEAAGALVLLVVAIGITLTLLGLSLVQAATARAVVEVDAGRTLGPVQAYRMALPNIPALLRGLGIAVVVWVVLELTVVLVPVAVWLAIRWILLAQVVELEERSAIDGLRRSSALVRGRWLRVASLVGVGALLVFAAGPLLGALLILLTNAPLALMNIVAGLVYAAAMPFVSLATTYVYLDARVRETLEPRQEVDVLPAQIELSA